MSKKPSITKTAFCCPHCGAYTTQYWHTMVCKFIKNDDKTPNIPDEELEKRISQSTKIEPEQRSSLLEYIRKMRSKLLFTDKDTEYGTWHLLHNLYSSQCYNCQKWSVWVNEDLIYPSKKFGSIPNPDLPKDVLGVVEEARGIIDLSPKGAAALLRLAIQMLCKSLGESGTDLNSDIAKLVKKGLNPIVQKSLDVVRVIGNESVHPGSINLKDDKETAISLFDLISIIAEQMITQPKQVNELYQKLPETKRKAIENRDGK